MKRSENNNGDSWSILASTLGVEIAENIADTTETKTESQCFTEKEVKVQNSITEMSASEKEIQKTSCYQEQDSFGKGLLDTRHQENLTTEVFVEGKVLTKQIGQIPVTTVSTEIVQMKGFQSEKAKEKNASEETSAQPKIREGRKNFFDRFPKINFFGSGSKETLAAVVGGVKNPSLSGKSFTSSKFEKVPVSQDWVSRREKEQKSNEPAENSNNNNELSAENTLQSAEPSLTIPEHQSREVSSHVAKSSDPWAKIASQVGTLSTTPVAARTEPQFTDFEPKEDNLSNVIEEKQPPLSEADESNRQSFSEKKYRQNRPTRVLPSMFDEQPIESPETETLKSLMETASTEEDAEQRLRSMFDEDIPSRAFDIIPEPELKPPAKQSSAEYPKSRSEGRFSTQERYSERSERKEKIQDKKRESSYPVDFEEDSFEKESSSVRKRGRRGARFTEQSAEKYSTKIKNEVPELKMDWDREEETKPIERSPRGKRHSKRDTREFSSRSEFHSASNSVEINDDFDFTQTHKSIPSWDNAINLLIEGNIERHQQSSRKTK